MQLLHDLKAEEVLRGTPIIGQITNLKALLSYKTDSEVYQFEDYFALLNAEIKSIERIELLASIPPGGAQSYLVDLAQALQMVTDKIEIAQTKAIYFQGKLKSALHLKDNLLATFSAWYQIAISEKLLEAKVKLSATTQKALAESEFSRLIGDVDINIDGLLSAMEVIIVHLKEMRKIAQEKYKLGSDQANASIVNLPFNGVKEASADLFPLLRQRWGLDEKKTEVEEGGEFDDIEPNITGAASFEDTAPSYVNRRESDQIEIPEGIHKIIETPVVVTTVSESASIEDIAALLEYQADMAEPPAPEAVVVEDPFVGTVRITEGKATRLPLAKKRITYEDTDGEEMAEPIVERHTKDEPMHVEPVVTKPVTKKKVVFEEEEEEDSIPF